MSPKEVSVGEFDGRTGLTHITMQRGRLMFHMGPSSARHVSPATAAAAVFERVDAAKGAQHSPPPDMASLSPIPQSNRRSSKQLFRSGAFTGRSLYVEEAVYLVKSGALVVYEMEEITPDDFEQARVHVVTGLDTTRPQLTCTQLTAHAVQRQLISPPALSVYTFLKDRKLHPRRASLFAGTNREPFIFDVFKSTTETDYVPIEEDTDLLKSTLDDSVDGSCARQEPEPPKLKKRKVKRLNLIFRAVVESFWSDRMLSPRELRSSIGVQTEKVSVPVKLAVADLDCTVLLFEIR